MQPHQKPCPPTPCRDTVSQVQSLSLKSEGFVPTSGPPTLGTCTRDTQGPSHASFWSPMGLPSRGPRKLCGPEMLFLRSLCADSLIPGPSADSGMRGHWIICRDLFANIEASVGRQGPVGTFFKDGALASTFFALTIYLAIAGM